MYEIKTFRKQSFADVLQSGCSLKFRKTYRKTRCWCFFSIKLQAYLFENLLNPLTCHEYVKGFSRFSKSYACNFIVFSLIISAIRSSKTINHRLRVHMLLFLRALRAHELVCLRASVFACLRVYLIIFLLCFAYIVKLMFGN